MIVDGGRQGLGRMKGWALALLLGMLAVPAQAETITSVTQYAYDAAGRLTCTAVRMNRGVRLAAGRRLRPGSPGLGRS
jgi:YD repeat-containing protein